MVISFGDIAEVRWLFFTTMFYIVCMHSIVFAISMQIRRSQHAVINPAITIILRMGAGGHGVPPLGSPDGW